MRYSHSQMKTSLPKLKDFPMTLMQLILPNSLLGVTSKVENTKAFISFSAEQVCLQAELNI